MSKKQRDNGWDVVRARHPHTGDHYTTTRIQADRLGATVLDDHQAVDKHGRWLPPKPNTTRAARETRDIDITRMDGTTRTITTTRAGESSADPEETS